MQSPKEAGPPSPEEMYEVAEGLAEFYADSMHISTELYTGTIFLGELRRGKKPILRAKIKVFF